MTAARLGAPGRVAALRRYPVKSLAGEPLESGVVDARGLAGDRVWSVRDPDGKLGSGKSTRRFRRMDGLLDLGATYDGDTPLLAFPDGRVVRGDDPAVHEALSRQVGRDVTLACEDEVSHFDEGPLHLVTTAALSSLSHAHGTPVDWRHTRANLLVSWPGTGLVEHDWAGAALALGPEVVLRVVDVMPRCVMVTSAQRDVPADPALLRTITVTTGGDLGVFADVERPGRVRVGDDVRLT